VILELDSSRKQNPPPSNEQKSMVSPYLKRPKRSLEDVLAVRYDRLRRALERLNGQARILTPAEVDKLIRLQQEIAALEQDLRRSNES